jgi:aminopeptidase S
LAALAAAASAQVPVSPDAAASVMRTVTAIAAGDDTAARREAIVAALRTAGVEPALEPFGSEARAGVNIVVTLPGSDPRTILVGAHYDRVAVGRGAVDNGAACAALIELIRAFKASPLARATLTFVFFDREENGLIGSREYFGAHTTRPAYGVNLDIFAYGDTLFATAGNADSVLLRSLKAAGEAAGVPVRDVPPASYPGSDHRSMIAAGIETVGLAIVDAADVEAVLNLGVAGLKPGQGPRILTIIHTPNDTLAEVKPDQMVRGIAVVEGLLRALDRQ